MARNAPQFYFEEDGSYNEKGPRIPKGQNTAKKSWWDSLSEEHREVIRWHTEAFGRGIAHSRNLDLQAFSRSLGRDHAPYMKGPEQHEFAYERFESFKEFCLQKRQSRPQIIP